jgi:uncharacterized protein (TIGR00369 family)
MIDARRAGDMSGLEFLGAIAAGEIPQPPIGHLIGMRLVEVGEGTATFVLDPHESHYNPIGSVHGGIIATACDSAGSCAIHSTLPRGAGYGTIDLTVGYLRPVTADTGRLWSRGEVIHVGGRLGTAAVRLEDESGRVYAYATVTCLVTRPS